MWLWEKVFSYGLLTSLLTLMILASLVSKSYHKIVPPWYLRGLIFSFLIIAMFLFGSLVVTLVFKYYMQIEKKACKNNFEKTREDVIAYHPVVKALYTTVRGDHQKLKVAESIIKNLVIEEIQIREKNTSNLLPLFSPIIVLIIWFAFPIQLPQNTSLYNTAITILGLGTSTLPIWKFFTGLESQSLILKFKRCLFLLEQTQLMANNINQQAIPVASTKPRPKFGSARGLIKMADDFDAPLADFDEYMP